MLRNRRKHKYESVKDGWLETIDDFYDLDFLDGDVSGYYEGKDNRSNYRRIECGIDDDVFSVCYERMDADGIVEEFFDTRHMGDRGRSTEMGIEDFTEDYVKDFVEKAIMSGDFTESWDIEVLWRDGDNAISVKDLYVYLEARARRREQMLLDVEWDAYEAIMNVIEDARGYRESRRRMT